MAIPDIDRERRRSFLITQWVLLGLSAASIGGLALTGMLSRQMVAGAAVFFAVIALVTAASTAAFVRGLSIAGLVTVTLYLDSALALLFFYALGEFETPALGFLAPLLIMAPLYGPRNAQWGLAGFQISLYLFLLAARTGGWLPWLPYGYMIDPADASDPQFLALSAGAFVTSTLCVAFLSGWASLDVLTSQAQLQQAVARRTRELSQINVAINHDLRAPLQTLITYSELLQVDDDARRQEIAALLNQGAWRMAGMLDSLRELSMVGDWLGRSEPVALEDAAADALNNLATAIERRRAQVDIQPLPSTLGDRALLCQMIQNLVENGLKYGDPESPRIRLEAAEAGAGRVAFAIEDNGPGVSPEDRTRIFEPFLRLERHRALEGTGTGLAVVERLVQAHGGRVRVEEGRGLKGARFVVELPAAS